VAGSHLLFSIPLQFCVYALRMGGSRARGVTAIPTPDLKRFLIAVPVKQSEPQQFTVVLN